MSKCGKPCEIYSRVCPVSNWNKNKQKERKPCRIS